MDASTPLHRVVVALALALLGACGGGGGSGVAPPLSPADVNLVFVVTPDVAHDPAGDVNPATGDLNARGLQRSVHMASFLKMAVLGGHEAASIAALSPATHPQTGASLPFLAALGNVQQFALLNHTTIQGTTADSFPIGTSYGPGPVPAGVAPPPSYTVSCRGLDYEDPERNNLGLVTRIVDAALPGSHVFSAPWETTRALLERLKVARGYAFEVPLAWPGPNVVLAVVVPPSGAATLRTFDSKLDPPATYPVLPRPVAGAACNIQQHPFTTARTGGVDGAVVPPGIARNQTVYLVRHAEAHPASSFEDGNYVGSGQWRALALPGFLRDRIQPDRIVSLDPAQALSDNGSTFSYVRPSLTLWPYAIARGLPLELVTEFVMSENPFDPATVENEFDYFFRGRRFEGRSVLVAWEHLHYPPLVAALLRSYGGSARLPDLDWPADDYDTIWTVRFDAAGNVTVDNLLCEGIDSSQLPKTPPLF
ncbi:MAG: hypothetical protein U1F10_12960 [Burkholderiales bacterium]